MKIELNEEELKLINSLSLTQQQLIFNISARIADAIITNISNEMLYGRKQSEDNEIRFVKNEIIPISKN